MRIVFICGSLEQGLDGVGDYTRRLAFEIIKDGSEVALLAFNDKYVDREQDFKLDSEIGSVMVLRLPSTLSSKVRCLHGKRWIDSIDPDWISLQFVPFAFHEKGLPLGLGRLLSEMVRGKKLHIMFHELWVGMEYGVTIKHRVWGMLQKQIIKSLASKLKPIVVHTQTRLYQKQLLRLGMKAEYLPLFSNISKITNSDRLQGGPLLSKKDVNLIVFGNIHPGAPITEFALEALVLRKEAGINMTFTFLGRNGAEKERWLEHCKSAGLTCEVIGEQSVQKISKILTQGSFGISTTPLNLIEKSGSVAAMLEHHLPIISIARMWEARLDYKIVKPDWLLEYRPGNLKALVERNIEISFQNSVSHISALLGDSLTKF